MTKLDYKLYLHDADKAAMAALKAIPGFSQVMKIFMKIWNEQQFRIFNMSTNLHLSEKQMAKYYDMLPPICEKLGIDVPDLFVEMDVHPNAYTYGDTNPCIVMTSGLLGTIPEELIPTVLAHECGHIACHHTLYGTMGRFLLSGTSAFLAGSGNNIVMYPIQLAFAYWNRCSELSADRAAVICDGSAEKITAAMMYFAGYNKELISEVNVDAFVEQAHEYKALVKKNAWNKTLEFILLQNSSHPLNVIRAYEGREWEKTERYQNILKYLDYMQLELPGEEGNFLVEVSPKKMLGKNVADIQAKLLTMGFENIKTVRNTDPVKMKEGNITGITIDGLADNGWYKRDDEIIIEYFEAKTEEDIALEHPDEIKIGNHPKYFLGKPYEEVEAELRTLGFENIVRKAMAMPKIGRGGKENCVTKITFDGREKFSRHTWFAKGAEVEICYHVRVK